MDIYQKHKNKKERICWITASYMLQVDLPVLSTLSKQFEIDWYFWGNPNSPTGKFAKDYAEKNNISLSFINLNKWKFNPAAYWEQSKIINKLSLKDYSIYYFDVTTFPWLLFAIKKHLPDNKVVLAMHHGKPHSGMRFKPLYFPFLKLLNKQDFYLQYFSNNQAEAFNGKDCYKKYVIPLALNNFGNLQPRIKNGIVTFTAFGNIIPTKNIELLIAAGNKLWKSFPEKFRIKIVGHCRIWDSKYANLITEHSAFELDIRRIEESEIPKLFSETDYLVLPYKAVTQSGPLRIAYGYNVPVIASDLDGFKESVVDGVTGLLFKNGDVESLCEVMGDVIQNYPDLYNRIKQAQKQYVESELSTDHVCDLYSNMFNNILSSQCQ